MTIEIYFMINLYESMRPDGIKLVSQTLICSLTALRGPVCRYCLSTLLMDIVLSTLFLMDIICLLNLYM